MSGDFKISDEEWENRQLCSDGNCIGVIGPDGKCKECGRPGEGGVIPTGGDEEIHDEPTAPEPDAAAASDEEERSGESAAADDGDDWANRRLCPDGNCIGVIGPDGKCKECGREGE